MFAYIHQYQSGNPDPVHEDDQGVVGYNYGHLTHGENVVGRQFQSQKQNYQYYYHKPEDWKVAPTYYYPTQQTLSASICVAQEPESEEEAVEDMIFLIQPLVISTRSATS